MRPDINRGEEVRPLVRAYAEREGLSTAEAWVGLVEAGAAAEGVTNDDSE